ncbi:hypothetical protein ACFWC5_20715 [Streptomyces sp. NPDC060085]|uniref:hypothetical protein n=1 Tax=Streptomyces sp. NPDC060085 TaxID=3347054 RepID=UPI00364A1619
MGTSKAQAASSTGPPGISALDPQKSPRGQFVGGWLEGVAWSAGEHPDNGTMPCGTVLDYRSVEQRLQSHADLWLTPLTGVDPAACGGAWADFLDQATACCLPASTRPLPPARTVRCKTCWR